MAGFAAEDLFLKKTTTYLPLGQSLILFGLMGVLVFGLWAQLCGETLVPRQAFESAMRWRALFEVTGRLFYALAIVAIPLSLASAILQATPLLVVAGAALLFGETVGWRRWSAIFIGFIGVLIILRPTSQGFDPKVFLAVVGLIGFAGRDLAAGCTPRLLSDAQLGFYGFIMLTIAGVFLTLWTKSAVWPTPDAYVMCLLTGFFGILAYFALTRAMRTGAVSVVTPFRYTRLIFAIFLATVFLHERPNEWTLIGAALVIGSGLYTLIRSARLKA